MYIMHIITMVRLALHCFPICSLVVSIMTNSVFLGQAPSVLYPKYAGKSEPRWPGLGQRSWSIRRAWGLRW